MMRDPHIKPALLTKLFSVSSLPWQMQAADAEDARSRDVAAFNLFCADRQDGGTRLMTQEILIAGLVDGRCVCEVVLRDDPERPGRWGGKRTLKVLKAKEDAQIEEDAFGNVAAVWGPTSEGWASLSPERFVVFKNLPLFGRPTSDLHAAYNLFVAKDILQRLWLIGIEKFGQPFAEGTYPANDEAARDALTAHMADLKSRTWVVHPDGTTIKFVDAAFGGAAAHQACWEKLVEGIFLSINGAFLQSITSGSTTTDPRGNAQTQKSTAELFSWDLAAAVAAASQPIWDLLTAVNFLDAAPPRATVGGVNDQDLLSSANLDDILVNKLSLPLSRKERAAYYGRQLAATPEDAMKPAPAGGGAPPGGAGGLPFHGAASRRPNPYG